jgi:radical SAM protein with 4Fe4S-binding SPASM domain
MTPSEFRHVAFSLRGLTKEIVPHLLGEPLTHPEFGEITSIAREAEIPLTVVTNGTLLDDARQQLLLDRGIRQVNISLQSWVANFSQEKALDHLARALSFCDRAVDERPDLYVNLRFWNLDASGQTLPDESLALRNLIFDHFNISSDKVSAPSRRKSLVLRHRQYLHYNAQFEWPSLDSPVRGTRGFCMALTGHIGVLSDGRVVPCCLDADANLLLGNIFETPLPEILASPRASAMREGFARNQLKEPLCQRCQIPAAFFGARQSPD